MGNVFNANLKLKLIRKISRLKCNRWIHSFSGRKIDIKPITCLIQKCTNVHHNWLLLRRQCYFVVTHDGQETGFRLSQSKFDAGAHSGSFAEWQIQCLMPFATLFFRESSWIECLGFGIMLWVPVGIPQQKFIKLLNVEVNSKRRTYMWMARADICTGVPG